MFNDGGTRGTLAPPLKGYTHGSKSLPPNQPVYVVLRKGQFGTNEIPCAFRSMAQLDGGSILLSSWGPATVKLFTCGVLLDSGLTSA